MTNKRTTKPAAIKAPGAARSGASSKRPKARALEKAAETSKPSTKTKACLDLLGRKTGAALSELMTATSWQAHSVRGFLSGTVKKKLGHTLISSRDNDGTRRYSIDRAVRER